MKGREIQSIPLRPLLFAAVAFAFFHLSPTVRAEEIPHITSFTASPSTIKSGHSTMVSAAIQPFSSAYHVAIVNTDTGELVTRCAATFSPCSREVTAPWSQNADPKDFHFEAEVIPQNAPPTGSGAGLTVHVERFEWNISLEASKNPLTVGESTKLNVKGLEPSPAYTGYHTKIVNDTTGENITTCWGYECWHMIEFGYSWQQKAGPVEVHAEVVSETAPYDVAGRADLTLSVDPIRFGVSMSFSEPQTEWNGERTWLASVTPTPGLYSTPFSTWIYRSDGYYEGGCALWITCTRRLGPGTYRALVADGEENVYAATGWWTISPNTTGPGSEPEEESADDFDLLALAAMFGGPSEVCTALLFYPGTHLEGSSVSDQYLACEEAVGKGSSTVNVLKAVAGTAGGTSVLWYLYEEKTKEQTPSEDTEPLEETEPPPVPPVGWPSEISEEAVVLRELNPQLESERQARIVIKQCHRLAVRASLPTSRCTELPIFASGDLDVPEATKHDLEALLYYPPWVKLNYESSAGKTGQGWYTKLPVCEENSNLRHCDEFPFFSTEQGGGSAIPRPSLKLIDGVQNRRQGNRLGAFYSRCGVNIGSGHPFLNVPMPPGSNVETFFLCNGNS
jgi:Deoxyribonuclease NucA/NucB